MSQFIFQDYLKRAPVGAGQAMRNTSHKGKMIILASSMYSIENQ